jgi:hypothetical protein
MPIVIGLIFLRHESAFPLPQGKAHHGQVPLVRDPPGTVHHEGDEESLTLKAMRYAGVDSFLSH